MIGRAVVAHDTVDGDVAGDGGATIVPSTLLASLPSFFLFFLLFSSLLSRKRNSYRGKKRSKTGFRRFVWGEGVSRERLARGEVETRLGRIA